MNNKNHFPDPPFPQREESKYSIVPPPPAADGRIASVQHVQIKEDGNGCSHNREEETCPLFMTSGLPPNFSTNPALCALASLIGDDEGETEEEGRGSNSGSSVDEKRIDGGGKYTGKNRSRRRRAGRMRDVHSPYSKGTGICGKKLGSTTVGEAQLFMGMWKI
mmetsp:Transcript_26930/g.53796  ORF Transcript_26930/g.53796 Transcript_26930/m.53796 type:complete len:163 (-) Transcript_26930:142-630(-)